MTRNPGSDPVRTWRRWVGRSIALGFFSLAMAGLAAGPADRLGSLAWGVQHDSIAKPPSGHRGAVTMVSGHLAGNPTSHAQPPLARPQDAEAPETIAESPLESDTIALAKRMIAACRDRYMYVDDYVCTFQKRERIDGKLTPLYVMTMKARARPASIYFKFLSPKAGREAIYVAGRHGGRVVAHDVGLFKLLAGTMLLDPRGPRAMEDCRHPITEAGIGPLIETIATRWALELTPGQTEVTIQTEARVGDRICTMIDSTHPRPGPDYLYHKVRLFIDEELGLPIRFESYDWPEQPGAEPPLLEEYTYLDLELNVGLTEDDFDPANEEYAFGRF